jgi:hypothetical protein
MFGVGCWPFDVSRQWKLDFTFARKRLLSVHGAGANPGGWLQPVVLLIIPKLPLWSIPFISKGFWDFRWNDTPRMGRDGLDARPETNPSVRNLLQRQL